MVSINIMNEYTREVGVAVKHGVESGGMMK